MDISPPDADKLDDEAQRKKPRDVIRQAKALDKADRVKEALGLLLDGRARFSRVPAAYETLIGRLYERNGEPALGVEHLLRAYDRLEGEEMPPGLRRDLAKALLADGRVENAGKLLGEIVTQAKKAGTGRPAWTLRRAYVAAIEAYENRKGRKQPDSGAVTPYRVLAQAEALVERKNEVAALALLRKHSTDWDDVPQSYTSRMSRLGRKAGDQTDQIERLQAKRAAGTANVSADKLIRLGARLFELGRYGEAGEEISAAIDQGAEIERKDLAIAADLYRRRNGNPAGYDTSFGPLYTLVNPDKKLVYVPITKNACTFLKTNFVLNSAYRDAFRESREYIHGYCDGLPKLVSRAEYLGPDYFRFTVLRDPARRLVSAYLNKVVRRRRAGDSHRSMSFREHTIRAAQEMAGLEFDLLRSITFEEFVTFLVRSEDYMFNRHWMPQFRFTGTDLSRYHHVGKLERLQETLDLLTGRFGFEIETEKQAGAPIGGVRHQAKYTDAAPLEEPHRALPRELDAFEDNMPPPDRFLTPALQAMLEARFAEDFAIYRAA